MATRILTVTAGFCFWVFTIASAAQELGDVRKGEAHAHVICAECHAVERSQASSPNSKAPSFPDIAATSGMTPVALRIWFQSPHPTMPNFRLTNEEKDDLIAYILSLKPVR